MAIYKGIKTGIDKPFYKKTNKEISAVRIGDTYYIRTEVAMMYRLIYLIFKLREPTNPLLQSCENSDIKYVTYDISDELLGDTKESVSSKIAFLKANASSRESDKRKIFKEIEIPPTPLLEHLIKNYREGFKTVFYYTNSRRLSRYANSPIAYPYVPYFKALSFPIEHSTSSETRNPSSILLHGGRTASVSYSLMNIADDIFDKSLYVSVENRERMKNILLSENFFECEINSRDLGLFNPEHHPDFTLEKLLFNFNEQWNKKVSYSNDYSVDESVFDFAMKKMSNKEKVIMTIQEHAYTVNIHYVESFFSRVIVGHTAENEYSLIKYFRKNISGEILASHYLGMKGYNEMSREYSYYNKDLSLIYLSNDFNPFSVKPFLPKKLNSEEEQKEEEKEKEKKSDLMYEQLTLNID